MERGVTHLWSEESLDAKARWFAALSDTERMEVFCEYMDLLLELNPGLLDSHHAEPAAESVQILERP